MATVFCLDCMARINLDPNIKAGQRLTCPHCGTELEVIDTSPLELDWAYDEPDGLWDSEDREQESDAATVGHLPETSC
jgi:lysine biosynthesis protein LysW